MHLYREHTVHVLRGIGTHTDRTEGIVTMRTTKKKQTAWGSSLLLFTATSSVPGNKVKSTARQLLKDAEIQRPVSLYLSHQGFCATQSSETTPF